MVQQEILWYRLCRLHYPSLFASFPFSESLANLEKKNFWQSVYRIHFTNRSYWLLHKAEVAKDKDAEKANLANVKQFWPSLFDLHSIAPSFCFASSLEQDICTPNLVAFAITGYFNTHLRYVYLIELPSFKIKKKILIEKHFWKLRKNLLAPVAISSKDQLLIGTYADGGAAAGVGDGEEEEEDDCQGLWFFNYASTNTPGKEEFVISEARDYCFKGKNRCWIFSFSDNQLDALRDATVSCFPQDRRVLVYGRSASSLCPERLVISFPTETDAPKLLSHQVYGKKGAVLMEVQQHRSDVILTTDFNFCVTIWDAESAVSLFQLKGLSTAPSDICWESMVLTNNAKTAPLHVYAFAGNEIAVWTLSSTLMKQSPLEYPVMAKIFYLPKYNNYHLTTVHHGCLLLVNDAGKVRVYDITNPSELPELLYHCDLSIRWEASLVIDRSLYVIDRKRIKRLLISN